MRAQSYIGLPEGYELSREINLQKDKKLAFWLNAAAAVAMLALLLPVLPRLGALPWGNSAAGAIFGPAFWDICLFGAA